MFYPYMLAHNIAQAAHFAGSWNFAGTGRPRVNKYDRPRDTKQQADIAAWNEAVDAKNYARKLAKKARG